MRLEFAIEMRVIAEEPSEEDKAAEFNEQFARSGRREVPAFDDSLFQDLLQIVIDLAQLSDRATARSHRKEGPS